MLTLLLFYPIFEAQHSYGKTYPIEKSAFLCDLIIKFIFYLAQVDIMLQQYAGEPEVLPDTVSSTPPVVPMCDRILSAEACHLFQPNFTDVQGFPLKSFHHYVGNLVQKPSELYAFSTLSNVLYFINITKSGLG